MILPAIDERVSHRYLVFEHDMAYVRRQHGSQNAADIESPSPNCVNASAARGVSCHGEAMGKRRRLGMNTFIDM